MFRSTVTAAAVSLAICAAIGSAPLAAQSREGGTPTGRTARKRVPMPAPTVPTVPTVPTLLPLRFGVHVDSLATADRYSVPVNFGVFWMGSWTQKYGWGYAEQNLAAAKARGLTPVVHWWYWGDDISPDCVERGCQDPRQGVWKDRATWYRMTRELAAVIGKTMQGAETIVIVETEFNKGGIEHYEPFDGYLLDQIVELHRIPGVKVVVGFGNWGLSHWARFDRAAAAADLVGTQLLRSSVRDASTYQQAVDTLVSGVAHLNNTFRKPSLVIDLALSSYPSAEYEAHQEAVVRTLFQRAGELQALGATGIVWRAIVDDASMDTSNYHGMAERHWGFVRSDGSEKPAFRPFIDGMRAAAAAALALR
jgi:hypothetical protein